MKKCSLSINNSWYIVEYVDFRPLGPFLLQLQFLDQQRCLEIYSFLIPSHPAQIHVLLHRNMAPFLQNVKQFLPLQQESFFTFLQINCLCSLFTFSSNTCQQRTLEPTTMLICTLKIQICRITEAVSFLQHSSP